MAALLHSLVLLAQLTSAESGSSEEALTGAAPKAMATALPPAARQMAPLNLDLRLTGASDTFLTSVQAGASAELGLFRLGRGTLAVGAQAEYRRCLSTCWALGALRGVSLVQEYLTPAARVSYHFDLPGARPREKLDFFALVMAGPVHASIRGDNEEAGISFRGRSVRWGFGAGAGASYFFNPHLFAGIEARLRFARGSYPIELLSGSYEPGELERNWNLIGLNSQLVLGLRL